MKKQADFDLIIFGGDGDLSFRKIFPALYHRLNEKQIDHPSRILVVSRRDRKQEVFNKQLKAELNKHIANADETVIDKLIAMATQCTIDADKGKQCDTTVEWFKAAVHATRVFYLATPATALGGICEFIHDQGYTNDGSRVVLEKPLGRDLNSSEDVNDKVAKYFRKDQIYPIDHYLGKETVQNLMVLRFANNIFERSWNAQEIDNIQMTVAESLGVGSRGNYYDQY